MRIARQLRDEPMTDLEEQRLAYILEQQRIKRWADCNVNQQSQNRRIAKATSYRLFGISEWVWFASAGLAAVIWIAETFL